MNTVPNLLDGHPLSSDQVSVAASLQTFVGRQPLLGVSDGFLLMREDMVGTPKDPTIGHDTIAAQYGQARLPIGCFVVPGEQNVLIDTGIGPIDHRGAGRLIGGNLIPQLRRHGFRPEDIDVVALTHLHGDHSGTIGDPRTGAPVFPRARTIVGSQDWDFFVTNRLAPVPLPDHTISALETLDRSGRLELVEDDLDIVPTLRRIAAPGHTPGHAVFSVHDGAEKVLILGDAMYCPQQLTNVDWAASHDVDPALARRTRALLMRDIEAHEAGAVGCHFPELRLGRILGARYPSPESR